MTANIEYGPLATNQGSPLSRKWERGWGRGPPKGGGLPIPYLGDYKKTPYSLMLIARFQRITEDVVSLR